MSYFNPEMSTHKTMFSDCRIGGNVIGMITGRTLLHSPNNNVVIVTDNTFEKSSLSKEEGVVEDTSLSNDEGVEVKFEGETITLDEWTVTDFEGESITLDEWTVIDFEGESITLEEWLVTE